ncbi:DUF4304 domain-containing protein [Bradyrhizobium sp. HKCCYLRH1065]|uniref:DUF4304 domain-containing protein n=1 Tax=unclassified Bradyrhizobium TaxID=2631580 RepID=UPI003EB78043
MALEDWKKIIAASVAELLEKRGFRKNGLRFSADRGDAKLLVEFQSSQMSNKTRLLITINLSIRLGKLDRDPSIFPGDGHWRKRIGEFMDKPSDYWWTCRNSEDAVQAGKRIAMLLETAALPEMEHLASAESLAALWASGQSPGLTQMQRNRYLAKVAGQPA